MGFNSYAQNFEDVMLWRALGHVQDGFYIDVGAQHPVVDSVSLAFHEHGWRGIHVEPVPQYAEQLRQQRPGDTVLQAAVGPVTEVLQFYEILDSGISTADADIAANHRARGFETREIVVPCVTLAAVFDLCPGKEIHWLKIDVEGYEAKVLASWGESRARPWIVVVESTLPLSQVETHEEWEHLLLRLGYEWAYFDGLNRYYVADTHPELKGSLAVPPNVFDGFTFNGTSSASFHALVEQRYQNQLAVSRAESESRVQAAETASQAHLERAAQLEQTHSEMLTRREQAHLEHIAQLEQTQREMLAQNEQAHLERFEQLEKASLERAQQLEQTQRERLSQMEQDHAARLFEMAQREARLVEQVEFLTNEVQRLLREQSEREREATAMLLETQRQAQSERAELTREWAELTKKHLAQADERQGQHLEREQSLMRQLHAAHEERLGAAAEIDRVRALLDALTSETTNRVEAIYQRAALDREQMARAHEQRMVQAQRDHSEERSAAELRAKRLLENSNEHRLRREQLGQELRLLGATLLAEQQAATSMQQDLAATRRELEQTRHTLSWRMTRPLRAFASAFAQPKKSVPNA